MSQNNQNMDPGFFVELLTKAKLIFKLIADNETPAMLKFLPIGAIIYWVFPLEGYLAGPFSLPLATPLDDIAVLLVAMNAFLKLVPDHLVDRHSPDHRRTTSTEENDDIIDGEFLES